MQFRITHDFGVALPTILLLEINKAFPNYNLLNSISEWIIFRSLKV